MSIVNGITDKLEFKKETVWGAGTGTGVLMGINSVLSWTKDLNSDILADIDGTATNKVIFDKVCNTTADYRAVLTEPRYFFEAFFGTLTDDDGEYTLSLSASQPSYAILGTNTSDKQAIIKGAKMSSFSLSIARDDVVRLSSSWVAKSVEDTTGTVGDSSIGNLQPFSFLCATIKIGDNVLDLENFELSGDRGLTSRRGINNTNGTCSNLPTSIVGRKVNLTFNGSAIVNTNLMSELNSSSRTDSTITIQMKAPNKDTFNLTLTGKVSLLTRELNPENEEVLMDFSGLGIDLVGSGTYTA